MKFRKPRRDFSKKVLEFVVFEATITTPFFKGEAITVHYLKKFPVSVDENEFIACASRGIRVIKIREEDSRVVKDVKLTGSAATTYVKWIFSKRFVP